MTFLSLIFVLNIACNPYEFDADCLAFLNYA